MTITATSSGLHFIKVRGYRDASGSFTLKFREEPPSGDWDGDGDVDLADVAGFELCFSGSGNQPGYVPPDQGCRLVFDFDGDGDIDGQDWSAFSVRMDGPTE